MENPSKNHEQPWKKKKNMKMFLASNLQWMWFSDGFLKIPETNGNHDDTVFKILFSSGVKVHIDFGH